MHTHEPPEPLPRSVDEPVLELRERELVRRYLIDKIEQREVVASPNETAVVAEWAGHADRKRLREQNRQLCALLDTMEESAVVFGPDGRVLYCNRRASQAMRETVGVTRAQIIGRTPAELGVPGELVIGRPIDEMMPLARARESFSMNAWGRSKEGQFDAVYRPDGTVGAVALVVRDVHNRKLAETRLDLLTKLSTLVGMLDYDNVAEALTHVPIPELADWCAISVIENKRIRRTHVAHRDPSKAPLRDALMREIPAWDHHPLWRGLLTGGFQLLAEVSDDLLRQLAVNEAQYQLLTQMGILSLMVVPLVTRGQIAGIITFVYTEESGRRYGRDDPPLAEELAVHAAHAFENARLMKNLTASETRFRIALAGARTVVYEQDTSLRYVWYYNPVVPRNLLGKTHEQELPAEEAALLTRAKRRVLEQGERVDEEMDFTFGTEERRHFRETIEPLRDDAGKIVGVIGAATDITEQQRTQQQLTAELDFRERMMGILGHDLRNPLGTIVMASDLLLRRPDAEVGVEVRDPLLRIRRAAGRMQEMIDTLLDFTRARFLGKVPVTRVPADLEEIAHGAVDELRLVWPDHAIDLQVHGDSGGEWDPARMAQTITNLVGNAIAYGERGTPVRHRDRGKRPRRGAEGAQPRAADSLGDCCRCCSSRSAGASPRIARRAGSGWGCTSSSRSCSATTARSASTRPRTTAPRSRCTCPATTPR